MTTRGFIVVAIIATLGSTPTSTLADGGFFKHERRELKHGEVETGAVR